MKQFVFALVLVAAGADLEFLALRGFNLVCDAPHEKPLPPDPPQKPRGECGTPGEPACVEH